MAWLPIALRLDGLRCVVVGGGTVAERKIAALLEAKASDITIVSPEATGAIRHWAEQGLVRWLERDYAEGDLAAASVAFAATSRRGVNECVATEAARCGCLVSVADDPDGSGFAMPAVVRRGKLTLTVATDGASPALARRIRSELEERYGPEYEAWLDVLAEARLVVRELVGDTALRQELHRELERWDVPALLRLDGGIDIARLRVALTDTLRREPSIAALQRLRAEQGLWLGER